MEEDNQDGPFTVWQMFNAPAMVLFDNLENAVDGLERLLTSILNISGDHSEVLVPRPGSKYPDSFYCEFNTWFLGRLFYVWSMKELDRIHETSKQAQLKILNILCANGASFYDKIHAEYISVLGKLIEYYKQREQPEQMLLENFTSQQIHCPNVQLNLEPIYVKVNNIETCESLIDCTLNLLSDTMPMNSGQIDSHSALYEALLDQILQVLEYFSLDLKLSVLNFYMKLINNYDKYGIDRFQVLFPNIYKELLYSIEAMTTAMSVYHEKGEINVDYIDSCNKVLKSLIKVDVTQDNNVRETVTNICTTILRTSDTIIFKKDLKQHCLSLSDKLDFPKDVTDMSKIDASLINTVTECYSQEILKHVQDTKGVDFKDSWYYKQILDAIKKLKCCEEQNIDSLVVADQLKKCASALNILTNVHLQRKNDASEVILLNSDSIFCIWMSLIKTIELHKNFLLQDRNCAFIMEITLNTAILSSNISKVDSNTILQLLCLQNTQQFTEKSLNFTDSVKLCISKYIMLIKLILEKKMTTKLSELWTRVISVLINSLISCKSTQTYQELISLCPLLLSNKVCSASKLIGDLLMPAFLTKDATIQRELTKVLKTISCMSFVDYNVVVKPLKDKESDHLVFENGLLNVSVACLKCFKTKEESDKEFLTKIRHDCLVIYSEVNNCTPSQHYTITGLRNLMAKFLNCKYYANLEESGFWSLMETMFKHFYMFDFGLSSDIMKMENSSHLIKILKPYLDDSTVHEEGSESYKQREKAFLLCVNLLVESTKTSLESNQHSVQTHTLNVITQFGSCCSQQVIVPSTKLLVYFIMHPQCSLRPKAVLYLREICEKHGFTPNQVYHRYKNDYCKLFVECSLYNGKEFATAILNVIRAFGFVGYRDFISKDVHHLLPYLIPYTVSIKEVPSMIEEIASLVQCSVSDFLIERFPYIYVHIYLNESKEVSSKCYNIIERLTETTVLSLIKRHFRVILTEFLLQYCCNPEKVLDACRYLARHDPDMSTPGANINMNTNDIADFLNPKFLGVLAYFDHKLVNAKVALSVKRKALKSFPDILQLMGVKYLTPLRFKVLATLRSALPLAKEFPQILAEAWSAFIHNIDSLSLAPLLSNLAVFLMQQYQYAAREINKIFHYLVLNNEHLLSTHIADLFFLEDTQLPDKIKLVIKRHVRRTQPEEFLDKIKWYLKHLEQDIPSIKSHAFRHLDQLLKSNRTEIHRAVFAGNQIHPVMVELIDALLLGCLEREPAVSSSSGACLGQLGAIEAAHLPRQYVQPDRSSFAFYIVDNSFVATALQELCRAFQYEQDTANMDCYALTIQEILKMYDISPTGSEKEVWDSFPEHMHQIMYPLLTSRYTLAYPSQPKKAHPLFGSAYATTFLEWAHNWWGQLVPLVECASVGALLRAVQPSMRRDSRTLFLFLPYVLLHAVTNTASHRYIQGEINAVIGLENFEAESVATDNTRYKMLRHIRYTPSIHSVQAEEGNQIWSKCSKTVYALLDFLNRWLLEWCATKTQPLEHEHYKAISSFLDKFDKLTIARGNFACGELERALQYLELYMSENKEKMQEQLPFLAEIYAALDEPDSVAGILSMKQSEPSLSELILAQVAAGRLQDAALCYERLAQETHLDTHSLQGMVSCYLALEQPFTARRLLGEQEADSMLELSAEPLWRLASWDQLHALTQRPIPQSEENWGLHMGRILLAYRSQEHDRFTACCKDATSRLLAHMDKESKGENALRSGYQSVLGLHIVSEATRAEEVFRRLKSSSDGGSEGSSLVGALLEEWSRRAALVQSDVRSVEPLLRARRVLLRDTQEALEPTHPLTANKLKSFIGELWLQSAKLARKAEMYQQAYMYILSAEQYQPAELFVEKSKMYWKRGQHEQAFTTLRRGLEEGYTHIHTLTPEQRKICAKAKLLIAKYNDETTKVDVDVNIGFYKESVDVFKEWEKSWVCLGAYYEKVCSSEGSAASSLWTRRLYALNSYGKALQCGHKYLYQSMPRMLSIWLDVEVSAHDTSVHSILAQMTEIIKTYSERLPLYLYLTAFSQIVSRICHPVKEVYLQLKAIIVQLIIAYPQHTLWNMMSVIKSSYPQRIKRCNEVLADQRLKEPRRLKLLNDFTLLAEKLIELCNKPIAHTGRSSTVSSLVRTLPKLLETQNFSHIMMPFQEFCKIVLPSKAARQEKIDFHVPVEPVVYIAGIEEHIQILPSLQKPRKVTLKGSDGKSYIIMLKPRDDLRKDYRLMEFNGVVNRFLQDAPETRRRRLYIRTYSVLPLNEECGVIEWVPNLVGLRPILVHIYKQKGIQTLNKEMRQLMCSNKDPLEKKRRIFEEQLLPRHPPVFQEWFRRVFSDPYGWYQARSAYIRTTAVISMVGYILGLGDRHGENISFDSTNGDTVHVDFNCLFNKGEALECPEVVPFRLTHNMEAAMGPLGHEGMFRKSCECVLRALRAQTAALMSVVGPFVYDPLVSWGRARTFDPERTNALALQHLLHIRHRLNGMVRNKNKQLSVSLSPEGQVEHLIEEATSVTNLCQMYLGWAPFL